MRGAKGLLLALVCLVTSLVAREAGAAHRIMPKRLHKGVTALSVDTVKSPATVKAAAAYQTARAELVKVQAAQQLLKAEQLQAQKFRATGLKVETLQPTLVETAAARKSGRRRADGDHERERYENSADCARRPSGRRERRLDGLLR